MNTKVCTLQNTTKCADLAGRMHHAMTNEHSVKVSRSKLFPIKNKLISHDRNYVKTIKGIVRYKLMSFYTNPTYHLVSKYKHFKL